MTATLAPWSSHTASHLFWSWFIFGGCFMVDATTTLLRRVRRGEGFNEAHRSHTYQHAARRRGSHKTVSDRGAVRSALPIFWFVAYAYVVTSRSIARALLRRGMKQIGRHRLRTAICGAGDAGAQVAEAFQLSPDHSAACFLDDRRDLQRKIVAPPTALADAIFRHEIELIVLATTSASSAQERRLIEGVEGAGPPVKILPNLFELVDGKAGVSDIRDVDVADCSAAIRCPRCCALSAQHRRQGRARHRRGRLDRQRAVPAERDPAPV